MTWTRTRYTLLFLTLAVIGVAGQSVPRVIPTAVGVPYGRFIYYTSVGTTEDEHAVSTGPAIYYGFVGTNTNAAARYLRCADQVIGSTTPGNTSASGANAFVPVGGCFDVAITCWLVTGAADTDVAEVSANELKITHLRQPVRACTGS
jgi:hypothetical protein